MSTPARPKTIFSQLYVILLLTVWWGANSYYAVHAQYLLRHANAPLLSAELTFMQLFLGLILSILRFRYEKSLRSERTLPNLASQVKHLLKGRSSLPFCIGFCHFIGTAFTNVSYAILGSTSTLVWKLSEPFSVVLLKWSILGKRTPLFSLVGIFHLIVGVMIFSGSVLSSMTVSPIIVANLAYPARNVAAKRYQDSHKEKVSGSERFLHIHFCCLPFIVLGITAKGIAYGIHLNSVPSMTVNALLFNIYQFASLELLDLLDALTHAVGNTLKRVFGVVLSAVLTSDMTTRDQKEGLGLACIGVLFYFIGENGNKISKQAQRLAKGIGFLLAALVMFDLIVQWKKPLVFKWIPMTNRLRRKV